MTYLNSVVASVPLFFDDNEKIDFAGLQKYLEMVVAEQHTQLLYLMAYNSRINLLSTDEVIHLNKWIQNFSSDNDIKYTFCTPYKASNIEVCRFLENFENDDNLYGVSLLFPERIYDDLDVVKDYFSLPSQYGMKTLMHEMKYISGKDGALTDWDIEILVQIQNSCPIVGIKEDSKNDALTEECFARLNVDMILAGGGLTQAANFIEHLPRAWLAGVSLIRPDLAPVEHSILTNQHSRLIQLFCDTIEKPFFELCKRYGWHCVHKYLLSYLHGFCANERRPMSTLLPSDAATVSQTWDNQIAPSIDHLLSLS